MKNILLLNDNLLSLEELKKHIPDEYNVYLSNDAKEAMEFISSGNSDLIICSNEMKNISASDLLYFCKTTNPNIIFALMTNETPLQDTLDKLGDKVFDIIVKPFNPDQLNILIEKAKNEFNKSSVETTKSKTIIGSSPVMQKIANLTKKVAKTDATVLLTGESGTGKELIASAIHTHSKRTGNYIKLNCAAIPENLLESELFGHEKGAFTNAIDKRVGRFELADKGTLLLDEISEISPQMQAKLLRVIQEGEFERVGGTKTVKVDVRIIATTNRNLKDEVKKGNFREDLYYRINVFPVKLPPLRDRLNDSIEIAQHFLNLNAEKYALKLKFSKSAINLITNYDWPGNIRELENIIERVVIMAEGNTITADDFPYELKHRDIEEEIIDLDTVSIFDTTLNLKIIEKTAIIKALEKTAGNKKKAAELLGFTPRTLRNKILENKITANF